MMVQVDEHFDDAMMMKMMAKNRHCSQSDPVGFPLFLIYFSLILLVNMQF